MYEYDEYNPKKKDEYEETEQESIDYSADGMEDEPHVDGESIEMEAEVISGEEYTEEISGEQFSLHSWKRYAIIFKQFISAAVAELADASDSKSDAGDSVWVRVPPAALFLGALIFSRFFFYTPILS